MEFLRDATPHELLALFIQWTGNLETTFLSIPEIAPLGDRVKEDHDALLTLDSGASAEAALVALQEAATPLDGSHDHYQRALRSGMQSAIAVLLAQPSPDFALVDRIEAALDRLQPTGLEIIKASYEGEAGNAAVMAKTAAEPEVATVLAQIPMMLGMTAADVVSRIGKVGAQLGDVEREKSVALKNAKQAAVPPAEVRRRCRSAAETVEIILKALDRSKAPAAAIDAIRQPVLDTVAKARDRKLAQRAAAKERAAAEKAAKEKAEKEAATKGGG